MSLRSCRAIRTPTSRARRPGNSAARRGTCTKRTQRAVRGYPFRQADQQRRLSGNEHVARHHGSHGNVHRPSHHLGTGHELDRGSDAGQVRVRQARDTARGAAGADAVCVTTPRVRLNGDPYQRTSHRKMRVFRWLVAFHCRVVATRSPPPQAQRDREKPSKCSQQQLRIIDRNQAQLTNPDAKRVRRRSKREYGETILGRLPIP